MRTAHTIERDKANSLRAKKSSEKRGRRGKHPNSLKNLRPFTPGMSGNPGGKPRCDVAGLIARAIFENNQEAAYLALAKALLRGNAYVFKELADRAYGKVKDVHEVTGKDGGPIDIRNMTDAELDARIAELVAQWKQGKEKS